MQSGFHIVIPARYASQRLPGKPLRDIAGKPMIEWVYQAALQAQASEVVVRPTISVSSIGCRVSAVAPV